MTTITINSFVTVTLTEKTARLYNQAIESDKTLDRAWKAYCNGDMDYIDFDDFRFDNWQIWKKLLS